MKVEELKQSWTAAVGGKLGGFTFSKMYSSVHGYVFRVSYVGEDDGREYEHFEVFRRKVVNKYDYENKCSLPELKVSYPGDEAFGSWAWCTKSKGRAMRICAEFASLEAEISD